MVWYLKKFSLYAFSKLIILKLLNFCKHLNFLVQFKSHDESYNYPKLSSWLCGGSSTHLFPAFCLINSLVASQKTPFYINLNKYNLLYYKQPVWLYLCVGILFKPCMTKKAIGRKAENVWHWNKARFSFYFKNFSAYGRH